ncbi:uncharacterized protein SETTUDRAFT_23287 [Exserohilum turcica Et28A]|uniref:JmjC domain-containing protein n=1 Tax=Exserohilum turcicum (strain 28A) TaxID=671987 RepID=R0I9J0_EXST2|nr:uncharacterized protein SETTUDRAFT_23287 [Exserohilum turcica Et28A]EOA82036.1 hypothetical protein SETTUDRAFT_23287 [Exserohilum turcica Et28A]
MVQGFILQPHDSGYLEVLVDPSASINLTTIPSFEETSQPPQDPEQDFQNWIEQPQQYGKYLICDPLKEHKVNKILDAGSLNLRPQIPGINSAYWYVSFDADTPAPMHIEDANTGSANLLLAGADKHWLIIHRSSASEFEDCVKKELSGGDCSQFVRHQDFIPGPLWLKKRGIAFEIVVQKPGDIMCTLPGRTYHAVRNTGKNFAVAINYEFEDAPDQPLEYRWCSKGRTKCGSTALTMEDFQRSPMVSSDTSSSIDTIVILQEELKDGPMEKNHLEMSIESTSQEFIKRCSNPEWFGYKSKQELQTDLALFNPGRQLNDTVLRQLLELISLPHGYVVVESLGLDLLRLSTEHIRNDDVKGLVFPFHVNKSDPSSTADRDHWAMGILDLGRKLFTTYDLPEDLSLEYKFSLECALQEESSTHSVSELNVQAMGNPVAFAVALR